jgi:hypothetical protein
MANGVSQLKHSRYVSYPHRVSKDCTPLRLDEQGSLLFYALVALPLVLTCTVFSLDLSRYYLSSQRAQQVADALLIRVSHYLPDTKAAEIQLYRALLEYPDISVARSSDGTPQVVVEPDRLRVVLEAEIQPLLSSFVPAIERSAIRFGVRETSAVQTVPFDLVLVLSDGADLSPAATTVWGDEALWPTSSVFMNLSLPCNSRADCGGDSQLRQRWYTQRCFNPYYAAIKRAAQGVVSLVAASSRNQLAVLTTPGSQPDLGFDRLTTGLSTNGARAIADWSNWHDPNWPVSDDLCVYIQEAGLEYASQHTDAASTGCSVFNGSVMPLTFLPHRTLSACSLNSYSLRDRIWLRATRDVPSTPSRSLNVLIEAQRLLIGKNHQVAIRGGISAQAPSVILAMLTELPEADPAYVELETIAKRFQISMYLLVYRDKEWNPASQELRNRMYRTQEQPESGLKIFLVESNDELLTVLNTRIIPHLKRAVLES